MHAFTRSGPHRKHVLIDQKSDRVYGRKFGAGSDGCPNRLACPFQRPVFFKGIQRRNGILSLFLSDRHQDQGGKEATYTNHATHIGYRVRNRIPKYRKLHILLQAKKRHFALEIQKLKILNLKIYER